MKLDNKSIDYQESRDYEMKNRKKAKIRLLLIIAVLMLTLAPISYAFFTSTITGNTSANNNVVQSGTMRLTFTDGNVVGTASNWIPGDYITKSFTVENTGTLPTTYSIFFEDVVNTFVDKSDLVYTIAGTTNGSNAAYSNNTGVQAPARDAKIINSVTIASGETHSYTITLTFLSKNENQDDNQGKRFEGKIQVYDTHNVDDGVSLMDKVVALKNDGATDLRYDGVETLGETSGTSDNNLRYVGATPANYIYYNCSTTDPELMNSTTCETWRIVGLFNNLYTTTSDYTNHTNPTSLLKIVRNTTIGDYSWDIYLDHADSINQWGASGSYEGADLMRELNTDYLGNITVGTEGNWFKPVDGPYGPMPTTLLNNDAVSMIQEIVWSTGGVDYTSVTTNAKAVYSDERSTKTYSNPSDGVTRTTSWLGKVALLYPSDYAYATNGPDTCITSSLTNWPSNSNCKNNDWIWTTLNSSPSYPKYFISPFTQTQSSVMTVDPGASITPQPVQSPFFVFPALYLKTDVMCLNCDSENVGTSTNPYKLSM